jgi:hypothetical protein
MVIMKNKKRVILVSSALILAVVTVSVFAVLGGPKTGLRAEVTVDNADIGIPGISKMYEARIINRGIWPVRVHYCAFVDDDNSPGTMVAYAVERWDNVSHSWTTIVSMSGADFCKPYPLGIVSANLTSRLLWPGQSLSTGEEATAARDGFNIGDRARFVVFAGKEEDLSSAIATPEFIIDEHSQTDIPLRVRH